MTELTNELLKNSKLVYQLDKDTMNVIYIPTGRMPRAKSEALIQKHSDFLKANGYSAIVIGVTE